MGSGALGHELQAQVTHPQESLPTNDSAVLSCVIHLSVVTEKAIISMLDNQLPLMNRLEGIDYRI